MHIACIVFPVLPNIYHTLITSLTTWKLHASYIFTLFFFISEYIKKIRTPFELRLCAGACLWLISITDQDARRWGIHLLKWKAVFTFREDSEQNTSAWLTVPLQHINVSTLRTYLLMLFVFCVLLFVYWIVHMYRKYSLYIFSTIRLGLCCLLQRKSVKKHLTVYEL